MSGHKRIGICEPLCGINLPKYNVTQPAASQESSNMRNAKRIHGRGWRKMSINTYKAMKRGDRPFLGSCYQKKH